MIAPPHQAASVPEIDWYSFLARPQLPGPSEESLDKLRDASILITGAGGSIGSALALRLAHLQPRNLVLLDASEQSLYRLDSALAREGVHGNAQVILGNISDTALLDEILAHHRTQFIFHAAAHKHGPLLETQPLAALANNTIGTRTLAQCVSRHKGSRLIFLSTDKAVEPISILGASKRIGEQITQNHGGTILRLCNVLGSEGSVVETFQRQITAGSPLTLTDADAERYFITQEEAVDLLLTSATQAPPGALLIPNLSYAHSIASLAGFLLSQESPTKLPIRFTGPRPGDKLCEKLWSKDETPVQSNAESYLALERSTSHDPQLDSDLNNLADAIRNRDLACAIDIVRKRVPDYSPSKTILDHLNSAQETTKR